MSKPTIATAMITAMPVPTMYISYGGNTTAPCVGVAVEVGASLTIACVSAHELP